MMTDVAVVGGGVSGLATAYDLARRGHRVVVLERQIHVGGKAVSERIGGFLMEHGPNTLDGRAAAAIELSHATGLDPLRCEMGPGVRYRYLVRDGGLCRIPIHPFGFMTSSYLSFNARLRLMMEALIPAHQGGEDESIAAFCGRRFGSEFVDRVIDPLVGGLFAGRADELSMAAVFPSVLQMVKKHGSVTRGVLRSRLAGRNMPGRRIFSWRDGIGTLPNRLVETLGRAVTTGVTVRRISSLAGGFRMDVGRRGVLTARAVVLATQPHVAASLLERLDADGAQAASTIDAPPLAVVFLGYRREQVDHPLDGMGYLTPVSEGRALTGAMFSSTVFTGRAPDGHVALTAYIGGARAPELARRAPAELIALARAEFRELIGAHGTPAVARVRQWALGLPQYRVGHRRCVDTLVESGRRCPGLFLTGNYLAGPSVAACLGEALKTSARVETFLLGHHRKTETATPARSQALG